MKSFTKYISLVAVLVMAFLVLLSAAITYSYAATKYSDVLDDLQTDPTFNSSEYGPNRDNTTLEVIQIAESSDGELFVYIYNPQADSDYNAKKIRLSQSIDDNFAPRDYDLTIVSQSGVFGKYVVNGLTLKSDVERYYNIVCLFRDFINGVDEPAASETLNYITYTPCEVAKCYTATTTNGSVTYTVEQTEVVEIKDKYVGFVRYPSSFEFIPTYSEKQDSHFVAFSTDRNIDALYEIDIDFDTQSKTVVGGNEESPVYGSSERQSVTITHTQTVLNGSDYTLLSKAYLNQRIEKTGDFLADEGDNGYTLTVGADAGLKGTQYVVRFFETQYVELGPIIDPQFSIQSTIVSDVTILRLKFREDGKVYNLGVVDNYQTGSQNPIGGWNNNKPRVPLWLTIVLIVVLILVLIWVIEKVVSILKK